MRIAVITGASSGMGREFSRTVSSFGSFDEVWVIARRKDRLDELKDIVPFKTRSVPLDLSDMECCRSYGRMLEEEKPQIGLLVNASGFGRFESFEDSDLDVNLNMVDLNCKGLMSMCQLSVPYMEKGSHIINIASVAALQPVPYINVYAASKAFVLSYSRALNRELASRKIKVTAVCPFWTKTEFFKRAVTDESKAVVKKYVAMYDPKDIVKRAWRDARRGKDVSKYGFKARLQAGLCKILPHKLVMTVWMKQQKLK